MSPSDQNRGYEGENPRNEGSRLFKALTRLFSGPLVNYDKQTARQLKRQSLEKYKNRFKSISGQQFKKSSHNPFRYLHHERLMNRNRAERYIDFDQMEYEPTIACLTGDTEVMTPSNGPVTIEELAGMSGSFDVWAWDNEKQKYTMATGQYAQKTGEKETVKVKLDSGEVVECTENHEFVMLNGEKKEAQEIEEGDRIMPFFAEYSVEEKEVEEEDFISEHLHYKWNTPANILPLVEENKKGRVVEVSWTNEKKEVYDLNVPQYHNFALKSGVISSNSALDIYADEITTSTTLEDVLQIEARNQQVQSVLRSLYYDILNVEHNLFGWARTMCKYGDFFLYLDIDEDYGITNGVGLPTHEVERLEGTDETNPHYVQFQWNSAGMTFEQWQVCHFRNLGNDKYSPYGTCGKKDTRVEMENGVKEIQNIEKGDKVYSFDEEKGQKVLTEVKDKICNGTKSILKIETDHNYIEVTGNHKVLTYNQDNDEYEYKFAKHLTLEDCLIVGGNRDDNGEEIEIDKTKPENNKNGYWNSIDNIPDYVTEDFAEFFGFLIGDGWIPEHNEKVSVAYGEHSDVNEKYESLLNKFSENEALYKEENSSVRPERTLSFYVNSKMLCTVLKRMGFEGDVYSKRIPDWVYKAKSPIRKAFLNGLIEADGSSYTDRWGCTKYQLELTNEQLIKDAKYLVQTLGKKSGKIMSRKRENQIIEGREVNAKKSYYFYFYDSQNTQMKKYKPSDYNENGDYIVEPIRSIKENGEEKVYDIHVEGNNKKYNNFYANGVVVHNSVLEPARRIWRQLCVHPTSKVLTNKGYQEIQNIETGEVVYAFDPDEKKLKQTKVEECRNMGEQDVYKVRTRKRSIKATAKHGLLTYTNMTDNWEYKRVEDIKTGRYGDRLALPVKKEGKSTHTIKMPEENYRVLLEEKAEYESDGIMEEIENIGSSDTKKNLHNFLQGNRKAAYEDFAKLRDRKNGVLFGEFSIYPSRSNKESPLNEDLEYEVDEEFCRFFGFMLGDGWASTKKNQVGFALGEYEEQNEKYEKLLQKTLKASTSRCQENIEGVGGQVNLNSAEAAQIMKKLGFISGASEKEVPEWIYEMNLECRREFVRGYFDADGGSSDGRVTSVNETLLEGIQTLCYMSGIPANEIKQDREAQTKEFPNGEDDCSASYRMYINMNEEKWYDDYQLQKVLDIELAEESVDTYDLQVEDDLHNFVVEGLVSHNTLLEDSVMAYRIVRSVREGQPIQTPGKSKKIENIEEGEKVLSWDPKEEEYIESKVTDWRHCGEDDIFKVKSQHRNIEVNKEHPLLIKDQETGEVEYKQVMEIELDRHMVAAPDREEAPFEPLQSIEDMGERDDIYDIRVENDRGISNFIANGMVVHNSPERRVFYVDVGGIDPEDVEQYIEKTITEFKRHTVVDEDSGQVDLRYDPLCYAGDAKLLKCNGNYENLESLANRDFDTTYVWALNEDGEVEPTKLEWVGKTKENANLIEIELDDEQTLKMTPDHRLIKRNGEVVEAQNLEEGDSLMPFYMRKSRELTNRHGSEDNFYTDIYQPGHEQGNIPKWKTAHKCSAEWKYGDYNWPDVIHHQKMKYNNDPRSLEKMTNEEHLEHHRKERIAYNKSPKGRKNSSKNLQKLWQNGVFDGMAEETWQDEEIREKRIDALTLDTDYQLPQYVKEAFQNHPEGIKAKEYEIREWLNNHKPFKEYLQNLNPDFENGHNDKLTKNQLRNHLRQYNFDGVEGMRDYLLANIAPWEKIVGFCRENSPTARREVVRHFDGIDRSLFRRIVHNHDMSLEEFDELFIADSVLSKECPVCSSDFETPQSDDDTYCSQECYWESLKGEKRAERETDICPTCLEPFQHKARKDKTYCSQECYFNRNTPQEVREYEKPEIVPRGEIPGELREQTKNHTITAIREVEENEDVYGVTVEHPEHNFAVAGANAPEFENVENFIKSGIFSKNSIEEDYYIPVRGDSQTKIEKLKSGEYTGDIDDVKHFRSKLFAALKVPQSYLTRDGDADAGDTTLAQKDIRFARTIQRLQRVFLGELRKAGAVHLYTLGFTGDDILDFDLKLNNPSKIAELQELEHWRTKMDVATQAQDLDFSDHWIAKNVFGFSEEEFVRNRREMKHDAKYEKQLTDILEGGEEMPGEELGGMGGGGLEGMEGLEGEEEPEEPFGGEEGGEGEGDLLATPEGGEEEEPGIRNIERDPTTDAGKEDYKYDTTGSKGKEYSPEKNDDRDMGARLRQQLGLSGERERGGSKRKKAPGLDGLDGIQKGITEKSIMEEDIKSTHQSTEAVISNLSKEDISGSKNLDKEILKELKNGPQ